MHAVWKSSEDWMYDREPVAVCTSSEAAWAVFRLLDPPWQGNDVTRFRVGPFPVKADWIYYTQDRPSESSLPVDDYVEPKRFDIWDPANRAEVKP
jgi:hypothetical protein